MKTYDQLKRELELANLAYAAHQGLHTDPRWREAMRRLEQEQENDGKSEKCNG
jgi:hypothetical protein